MFIKRRDKEDNLFRELQASSLKMIQELSGNLWTDYNDHDPGITILDHLHYALFELQYIQSFPFADYLHNAVDNGEIDFPTLGLYPSGELFAPSIVTAWDYEQLFMRELEEIKICQVVRNKYHTYTIRIETLRDIDNGVLKDKLEKLYHAHRNLGEMLGEIIFLSSLTTDTEENREFDREKPVCTENVHQLLSQKKVSPEYSSIQNDFPDNYGINQRGKPTRITLEHEARIIQLKGYMLIFDYLMADNYRQVNDIPSLLSVSGDLPGSQLIDIDIFIEDIGLLIDRKRKETVSLHDQDNFHLQQSRYLDMLDSLYGEDTSFLTAQINPALISEANRRRAQLIYRLIELNTNRFRSFNILDPSPGNIPVVQYIVSAILGYDFSADIPLTSILNQHQLRLLSDNQFYEEFPQLFSDAYMIEYDEEDTEEAPVTGQPYDERRFGHFRRQLHLLWHKTIFESYLRYGSQSVYYRIAFREPHQGYFLIYKHPGMMHWLNMGFFFEKETLIKVANDLWKFVANLTNSNTPFYLVEHILLANGPQELSDASTVHTLSVVIPAWNRHYTQDAKFETLLMERLPAHLTVRFLQLDASQMYRFENLYYPWREALANRKQENINSRSDDLKEFLDGLKPLQSV